MSASKEYILVTGGAGYIGSHTTVELIQNGYNVLIVDNLVNSSYDAVARIEYIVRQKVPFHKVDIGNGEALSQVFRQYNIVGVIHFAALKAVGESTQIPLDYYYNNVRGTLSLLTAMKAAGVKTIVFSSSATVYGDATRFKDMIPIPEHCPTGATNPYGRTKLMIENMLADIHQADASWRAAVLRYFNPIGAHPSGLIGEDPLGIPNNLLPYLAQVAVGRREKLSVFGDDYDSSDGTPIRDYIHVVDLARGHLSALEYLRQLPPHEGLYREWNLGTGKGLTVFEVYRAFCKAIGRDLPYEVVGRRAGDVLNLTANPERANLELKWQANLSIETACKDLWRWTTENPYGFSCDNYLWQIFASKEAPDSLGYLSRLHTVKFADLDFVTAIANYGALIQSIQKHNHEFVQGFDGLDGYLSGENPYFGATIGRYANRIGGGRFKLGGESFQVDTNENNTLCLHGGKKGLDKQYFLGPVVKQVGGKNTDVTLEFVYVDVDGNNGFPADLVTFVKYTIGKEHVEVELRAEVADKSPKNATVVNLTNHSYFRLSETPTIDGAIVTSVTKRFLEADKDNLPTGRISSFDENLLSGQKLDKSAVFDHCLVVKESDWLLDTRGSELTKIFEAKNDDSGRRIDFWSTEPAFQFYTGDGITVRGREARSGFCVEPGRFTNAVNVPEWDKQVVLKKGEVYGARFKYVFA